MLQILELIPGLKIKVSDSGEAYSLDHKSIRKNGRIDNRKGKKLKAKIDKYGYKQIAVSYKGNRKSCQVHRLVAMAFIPNPDNKETVNHMNGNKLDNRVENLEWATQKEQKIHAIKTGLCSKNIEALKIANKKRARKVIFHGTRYNSINEARKKTGFHQRIIQREGIFI